MKKILTCLLIMGAVCLSIYGVSLPEYHQDMINSYNLANYLKVDRVRDNLSNIKIAILERGFAGAEEAGALPEKTVIVNQYDKEMIEKYDLNPGYEASPVPEAHGRRVAQLVWAMTGMDYEKTPQFYLLNANGFTNFRRAIRYAIQEKVDIIVYAQNWEYGGNYDGEGFINAAVDEALEAGIIWINAAGNYGDMVYNDSITPDENGNLIFQKVNRSTDKDKLFFTVNSDEKDIRILCVWNDFSDDRDYQSTKDLDLYVYEWNDGKLGELVGESVYAQVSIVPTENPELAKRTPSQLAREEIYLNNLRKNQKYAVMVRDVSGNFKPTVDKIRVIVHGNSGVLTFNDHTSGREIMIPADNPGVISVGDLSSNSSTGPTMKNRSKPEVVLSPWLAEGQTNVYTDIPYASFSDGVVVAGTSADAAIFAGITAVLKANRSNITRLELLQFAGRNQAEWRRKSVLVSETVGDEYMVTETESGETVPMVIEHEVVTVYPNPITPVLTVGVFTPPPVIFVPPPPLLHPKPVPHHPIPPPPFIRKPVSNRPGGTHMEVNPPYRHSDNRVSKRIEFGEGGYVPKVMPWKRGEYQTQIERRFPFGDTRRAFEMDSPMAQRRSITIDRGEDLANSLRNNSLEKRWERPGVSPGGNTSVIRPGEDVRRNQTKVLPSQIRSAAPVSVGNTQAIQRKVSPMVRRSPTLSKQNTDLRRQAEIRTRAVQRNAVQVQRSPSFAPGGNPLVTPRRTTSPTIRSPQIVQPSNPALVNRGTPSKSVPIVRNPSVSPNRSSVITVPGNKITPVVRQVNSGPRRTPIRRN